MPIPFLNRYDKADAEILGFSKDVTPWIGVCSTDGTFHTNPAAGRGKSRIHTYVRQVRVIVVKLRERLDRINEEIKLLSKMKIGIARSLDQLNRKIGQQKLEAIVNIPRFIKNRSLDATLELYQRGPDAVKLHRLEMKEALRQLQGQYKTVYEQLQTLASSRNELKAAILERTRILDMFPHVVSSTNKLQGKIKEMKILHDYESGKRIRAKPSTPERVKPSVNLRGVPLLTNDDNERGCISCLPNALTEHCKSAIDISRQSKDQSIVIRRRVKSAVEQCFRGPKLMDDTLGRTNYRQCLLQDSAVNPYQAVYRSKNFKTITNPGYSMPRYKI